MFLLTLGQFYFQVKEGSLKLSLTSKKKKKGVESDHKI